MGKLDPRLAERLISGVVYGDPALVTTGSEPDDVCNRSVRSDWDGGCCDAVWEHGVSPRRPRGELPLLLCIRFRGTIDDWDPALLTVLASDRDVVVFDGPGIGHSAGAAASTVAEMAAGALELVSALDLQAVDLLGWSLGGFVAQSIALTHPALVGRLIIAGSKPGPVPGAPARDPKVGKVAGKPVNDAEDLLYLFFPPSPKGRPAGVASLERISATPDPAVVSSAAVHAQSAALMSWSSGAESAWDRLDELEMRS